MPEGKQLTLKKKKERTCSPNLQLISWLKQRHHTSSSRTSLCQTLNVFILCQTERAECVPKTGSTLCQQRTSVLGIIRSALGCWLCLTFNLSTGDPVWKKREKKNLMGASRGPPPCLPLNYNVQSEGKQRKSEQKMFFSISTLSDSILVRCCVFFLLLLLTGLSLSKTTLLSFIYRLYSTHIKFSFLILSRFYLVFAVCRFAHFPISTFTDVISHC